MGRRDHIDSTDRATDSAGTMGGDNVTNVATKDELKAVMLAAGGKNIIIDFTATWCGPCKMIGPTFVQLSDEFPNLVFVKIDVDEADELAALCGVSAMPTFMVFSSKDADNDMDSVFQPTSWTAWWAPPRTSSRSSHRSTARPEASLGPLPSA